MWSGDSVFPKGGGPKILTLTYLTFMAYHMAFPAKFYTHNTYINNSLKFKKKFKKIKMCYHYVI